MAKKKRLSLAEKQASFQAYFETYISQIYDCVALDGDDAGITGIYEIVSSVPVCMGHVITPDVGRPPYKIKVVGKKDKDKFFAELGRKQDPSKLSQSKMGWLNPNLRVFENWPPCLHAICEALDHFGPMTEKELQQLLEARS